MAKQTTASDLRQRITLQANSPTGWQDACTLWAAVEPLSVQATIAARQAQQQYTHKITIRYRNGIVAGMRVLYNGTMYEIVSPPIDKEERHRYLQLLCVEVDFTDSQMSQEASIYAVVGYGRRDREYAGPVAVRCRIDRHNISAPIGYFPVGTQIAAGYRVECDGFAYEVLHVCDDLGVTNVAHVEVNLRGLQS